MLAFLWDAMWDHRAIAGPIARRSARLRGMLGATVGNARRPPRGHERGRLWGGARRGPTIPASSFRRFWSEVASQFPVH